jgi:hypothetical protein
LAADLRVIRQAALDAAFLANPNRFKNRRPQLPPMPTAAWINPPPEETKPTSEPFARTLFAVYLDSIVNVTHRQLQRSLGTELQAEQRNVSMILRHP